VRMAGGEELEAEILISGVGQLNRPYVPDLPGLGEFEGPCFHSAEWRHDVPLAGRDVAVIGNAASAIQFVPRIARETRGLTIFQRSANWMIPKFDRAYSEREIARFRRFPWLARLYRAWIWLSFEMRWPVFRGSSFLARRIERLAIRSMRAQVRDPRLQEALIPDYPLGGKRILISDDYYPTLARENVRVVTEPIARIGRDAVVTRDGSAHPADVLILATGFESTSFLAPMKIEGRDGRALHDVWKNGAEAYLGLSVSGFPNFFMTYGPNTNLGHNSIIFMIECQTRYIVDCLRQMARRELAWIDLRRDVMDAYNRKLQQELARTVWARTDHSWYKTREGRITNNWSGSTIRYWWATRRADLFRYEQGTRREAESSPSRRAA
jgi:cation diffusion facilitator CzcD-associated flavoprotein CzcO